MSDLAETRESLGAERRAAAAGRVPGLLLVFSGAAPVEAALPLSGDAIELGRGTPGLRLGDSQLSRQHARVAYSRASAEWSVRDLGSRNGTAVDGRLVDGVASGGFRVLRAGGTLFLLLDDLRPYMTGLVREGGLVRGAALRAVWRAIEQAAQSPTLHIHGETGSGKELAARRYHAVGPRPNGPFIGVNCAAIPQGVAERLLFGARRGAFSGATADAEGYVQAASGGTLFLDEVAELEPATQAKLLRVLETREVLPLGAARPVAVELRLCSATHQDLWTLVATGRFRADLYYRIGRPQVAIPPLRERLDEIPQLVADGVRDAGTGLEPHASLVEACLLRPWPGNVRELHAEAAEAARRAAAEGAPGVRAAHLSPRAGMRPGGTEAPAPAGAPAKLPADDVILAALRRHRGQVATAARALGVHRNQLRRWLKSHDVDPAGLGDD